MRLAGLFDDALGGILKGGLVGAATGMNPTDLIASGGILGAATGKTPGLTDFLLRPEDKGGII